MRRATSNPAESANGPCCEPCHGHQASSPSGQDSRPLLTRPLARFYAILLVSVATACLSQVSAAQSTSVVLPSSAYRSGAGGAEFHTDVRVMNPGFAEIKVFATMYDQATGAKISAPLFLVSPRSQMAFENVHATLFERNLSQGAYGPIRFDSTGPMIISAAVNNVNACGAGAVSGQWLPGIETSQALKAGLIPHLAVSANSTSGYRTNLVFMNPGGEPAWVTVKVRNGAGTELASSALGPLAANGFYQVPLDSASAFSGVSGRTDPNLWIEFSSTSPVLAYASVINNASGDPFAVIAIRDAVAP